MDAPLANTRPHCVTHSAAADAGTSAVTVTVGLRRRVVLEIDSLRCAIMSSVHLRVECSDLSDGMGAIKSRRVWWMLRHLDEILVLEYYVLPSVAQCSIFSAFPFAVPPYVVLPSCTRDAHTILYT
jgi:hypothetical protein